jgi:hypothetical protein
MFQHVERDDRGEVSVSVLAEREVEDVGILTPSEASFESLDQRRVGF